MRLFVSGFALGAVVAGLLFLHSFSLVSVQASRQSQFIRTFNPNLVGAEFGRVCSASSSSGSGAGPHGVWNERGVTLHVALDRGQMADVLQALRQDVRNQIDAKHARFVGEDSGQGIYSMRYEDGNASGVVRIGPEYPDAETGCAWGHAVPVWVGEWWYPNK